MTASPLIQSVLQADETVLWSETLTPETLTSADIRTPLRSTALAVISFIFGLWFAGWGAAKGLELLGEQNYLLLSFAAPVVIVLALVFFWYGFISLRGVLKPPLIQRVPLAYAVTNQRLLAVLANGDIADEMPAADIGALVDLNSDEEILVCRRGDKGQENAFYMMLIEDVDGAEAAIRKLAPAEPVKT